MQTRYIRSIFELVNSSSNAVKYEAAVTLTVLTQAPAAVKAAASAFIELIVKESDNNVKLIVLDRVDMLRSKHEHVLDDLVMDVLRVLDTSDMELRKKALGIALEMVTGRNIEDLVLFFKKELTKTLDTAFEKVSDDDDALALLTHAIAEPGVPPAANSVHTRMRHQIQRSCGQCRPCADGLHWRLQQHRRCRRHRFRARSCRAIPRPAIIDRRALAADFRRYQGRQSLPWRTLDRRRVWHECEGCVLP